MLTRDVLCTPQFFDSLTAAQKKDMLQSLESNIYFDSDAVKEDMFASVRKKINRFQSTDYYLSSCELKIWCSIDGNYIRKTIVKKIGLCARKQMSLPNFPLCSTSFPEADGGDGSQVKFLKIDDQECDVETDVRTVTTQNTDSLSKKSGYTTTKRHLYKKILKLSPEAPTVIEIEYTTVVPKNDRSYICRVETPCQKFKFEFYIDGDNKNQYIVSLSAFGFIDNGKGAPNLHDDTSTASIEFNDWIFPQDGVAVAILDKSPVPAVCQ